MSKTDLSSSSVSAEAAAQKKNETKLSNNLTVPEVAAELKICLRKAWDEIYKGNLKAFRVGRSVRVRRLSIEEYIYRNTIAEFDAKKAVQSLLGGKRRAAK